MSAVALTKRTAARAALGVRMRGPRLAGAEAGALSGEMCGGLRDSSTVAPLTVYVTLHTNGRVFLERRGYLWNGNPIWNHEIPQQRMHDSAL